MLINMKDRRHTGTMIMAQTDVRSGHANAIVKPIIMPSALKIENIVQFTIDGRPVQLLAKKKRTIAFVCIFNDNFLE